MAMKKDVRYFGKMSMASVVAWTITIASTPACRSNASPAKPGPRAATQGSVATLTTPKTVSEKAPLPAPAPSVPESPEVQLKEGPREIPVREGLTIVTALAGTGGDYESIKKVFKVSQDEVVLSYSADQPMDIKVERSVLRKDMEYAHEYSRWFYEPFEKYPGTTALGVSSSVLQELKSKGESTLRIAPGGTYSQVVTAVLHRVEADAVPVPAIVNDERVLLRAIHAQSTIAGDQADFYLLDYMPNPICLRFKIGPDRLNVVKIAFTPDENASDKEGPAAHIEQELQETGRAEIYGIYFDFASARIRDESEPVLKEIAGLMQKNPTWKLRIEGHTDNIGGDAYNLELSNKRAASVKDALVTRYQIAAERLDSAGFGASRPKEANDTLEGRARNRRVELVKQ
jgi:outer membrane protein OmpA-like peptidoglycan-associated protein